MKTKSQIEIEFAAPYVGAPELTPELRDRIRAVQLAGARHGKAGYYPDGDFSSDADWCYGVGAEINALESLLDIDDGTIGTLYSDAHSTFFRDGTINPSERDSYSSNSVFTFHFGAYGDTTVSLWAQSDHVEDALEMAAEWLAEHAPGIFVEPDYADAAREIGVGTPFEGKDVADLYAAGEDELADRICTRAEMDLTYTESGYLVSWEWTVDESDTPPGPSSK
jgi:hypothetical protein